MENIYTHPVTIMLALIILALLIVLLSVISWSMKKHDRLIIEKEQEYDRGFAEGATKMMNEYSRSYELTD